MRHKDKRRIPFMCHRQGDGVWQHFVTRSAWFGLQIKLVHAGPCREFEHYGHDYEDDSPLCPDDEDDDGEVPLR